MFVNISYLWLSYTSFFLLFFLTVIRSGSGDYVFTVGSPGSKFRAGGTEFTYHVGISEGNYRESIISDGKLNQSLTIEVNFGWTHIHTHAHTQNILKTHPLTHLPTHTNTLTHTHTHTHITPTHTLSHTHTHTQEHATRYPTFRTGRVSWYYHTRHSVPTHPALSCTIKRIKLPFTV